MAQLQPQLQPQLLPAAQPQLLPAAQPQLLPAASKPRITDRAAAAGSVAPGEGVARAPTDVASMLQQTRAGLQTALKEITSCRTQKQQCTRDLAACEASSAHTGKELQAESAVLSQRQPQPLPQPEPQP